MYLGKTCKSVICNLVWGSNLITLSNFGTRIRQFWQSLLNDKMYRLGLKLNIFLSKGVGFPFRRFHHAIVGFVFKGNVVECRCLKRVLRRCLWVWQVWYNKGFFHLKWLLLLVRTKGQQINIWLGLGSGVVG